MKKAKSFRELQEATAITFPELLATLTDYARGGWGIYARVVIPIIERIKPDQTQKATLLVEAMAGFENQDGRGEVKDAREYELVMEFLKS